MTGKPVVILRPQPQQRDRIFTRAALARLHAAYEVVDLSDDEDPAAVAAALPRATAVIGQPDLPADLLATAPNLRVVVNVEGNFFPNVDYAAAFAQGVRVLGCGVAYAQAVAEFALGLALDLARGISREDRAARHGRERYVADGNAGAILLQGSDVGLLGFGNLGRALVPLLAPFRPTIRCYDPWLPPAVLAEAGLQPSTLDETLRRSRFVFVLATVTADSEHLLNAETLAQLPDGARLILVSRAAVADFDALLARIRFGQLYAAIDVWPDEPLAPDDPFRAEENVIISGHRAGGIRAAFESIGEMVCDDLELIARGLPPVRLQQAAPELVTRYRNRPVG